MSPNCAETIEMELEQNWVDTNPVDKKLEHEEQISSPIARENLNDPPF